MKNKVLVLLVGFFLYSCSNKKLNEKSSTSENDMSRTSVSKNYLSSFSEFNNFGNSYEFNNSVFVWSYKQYLKDNTCDIQLLLLGKGILKWELVVQNQNFIPKTIIMHHDTSFSIDGLYKTQNTYVSVLKHFDKKGKPIWEHKHSSTLNIEDTKVSIVSEDNFLYQSISLGNKLVIKKFNLTGEKIKESTILFPNENIVSSVLCEKKGSELQSILSFDDTTSIVNENESKYYLSSIFLDSNLNQVYRLTNNSLNTSTFVYARYNAEKNEYYVLCHNIDGSEYTKTDLLYFDSLFNIKWKLSNADFSKKTLSLHVIDLKIDKKGNLLATGGVELDDKSYKQHSFFAKVSPQGKVIDFKINKWSNTSFDFGVLLFEMDNKQTILSNIILQDTSFYKLIDIK